MRNDLRRGGGYIRPPLESTWGERNLEEKVHLLDDPIGEPLMGPLEDKVSKARPRSEVRETIPPSIVQDVPQYPVSKGLKPSITGPDAAKYLAYAAKCRAASKGKQRSVMMVGGEDNWELISRTGGFSRGGVTSDNGNPFVTATLVSQINKPSFTGKKSDCAALR